MATLYLERAIKLSEQAVQGVYRNIGLLLRHDKTPIAERYADRATPVDKPALQDLIKKLSEYARLVTQFITILLAISILLKIRTFIRPN